MVNVPRGNAKNNSLVTAPQLLLKIELLNECYSAKGFFCFISWDHLRIIIDKRMWVRAVQLFLWFPLPNIITTSLLCVFILFWGLNG